MSENDFVLNGFLEHGSARMNELAENSDTFGVVDRIGIPPRAYLCRFEGLEHLVKDEYGIVSRSMDTLFAEIRIPNDYLRTTDPNLGMRVVGIGSPIFHPNVRTPLICLGSAFRGGTCIHEIVRMVYEVLTYQVVTADEGNALDSVACRYLRDNPGISANLRRPPLRRRAYVLKATVTKRRDKEES